MSADALLALGAPEVEGDLGIVIASVTVSAEGGLVVALEIEDGQTITMRLPAHAVNWNAVTKSGRAA